MGSSLCVDSRCLSDFLRSRPAEASLCLPHGPLLSFAHTAAGFLRVWRSGRAWEGCWSRSSAGQPRQSGSAFWWVCCVSHGRAISLGRAGLSPRACHLLCDGLLRDLPFSPRTAWHLVMSASLSVPDGVPRCTASPFSRRVAAFPRSSVF